MAENIRQVGNKYFSQQKFREALKKYSKAVRYLDESEPDNSEQKKKMITSKAVNYSNSAACHLKLNEWGEALRLCEKVRNFCCEHRVFRFISNSSFSPLKLTPTT